MVAKMESLVLNQYCLKVKCHLTFCRTSYATEDPFVVKVVFVLNRICLAQNFVLDEDLRTCCLNVSSLGGSLTKVESLTVSNFTRNLFRSIWHRFDFPFESFITSTKDCRRYIPVHELCKSLSSVVCEILPADHALIGCDTTVHAKLCGYPPLLVCLPNNCNLTYHSDSTFLTVSGLENKPAR
jgi:hypothetical protein